MSDLSTVPLTRRALVGVAATAAAVAALPAAASAASAQPPDPVVALVDRFLPLYAAYRAASRALISAYEKYKEQDGHEQYPIFQFGFERRIAFLTDGNVSEIESYYAKCLDQAETKAQRDHLRRQCEQHVKRARLEWEEWHRFHHEAGLYDLEALQKAADVALVEVEETVLTSKPISPQGVAAMIRVALAYGWDEDEEPEDQPPEIRALRSALGFFGGDARPLSQSASATGDAA